MARVQMYSMEWCPYCAKAKALLGAKGIEYEEVDVTDDEPAAVEMIERTGQRGVPQFFIDDEYVGGYDNLAYMNATGALDELFGIESKVDLTKVWDVAVVGGGPAGLSAAMYAARKNLSTIIITMDLGGQVGITHLVTNYPGMPVVEGPELVRLMFEQAYMYGLERLIGERVQNIRVDGRAKVLELASGKEVKARSVILASGAEKRRLEIPGEDEFAGRGVVYCSTCDGPFYRDKIIAIVGGGSSALEAAVEMSGIAEAGTRSSASRVRCTRQPSARSSSARRRPRVSVTSFLATPPGDTHPRSLPPWPGSMVTDCPVRLCAATKPRSRSGIFLPSRPDSALRTALSLLRVLRRRCRRRGRRRSAGSRGRRARPRRRARRVRHPR